MSSANLVDIHQEIQDLKTQNEALKTQNEALMLENERLKGGEFEMGLGFELKEEKRESCGQGEFEDDLEEELEEVEELLSAGDLDFVQVKVELPDAFKDEVAQANFHRALGAEINNGSLGVVVNQVKNENGEPIDVNLQCQHCLLFFENHHFLKFHQKLKHRCDKCSATFHCFNSLAIHVKNKHDFFFCDYCPKKYRYRNSLKLHIAENHTQNPITFNCHLCAKIYKSKAVLKKHVDFTHTDKEIFTCKLCKTHYKSRESYEDHMIKHDGKDTVQCDICNLEFTNLKNMKYHKRVKHTISNEIHRCEVCNQNIYYEVCAQKTHTETVHAGRQFQCDSCDKRF
ncbi:KRAB [Lepeophtheirus salmonis]|uniref:KRAB n=1 Tax=Lepeophtheirus salmonis TaxID=72036 RepID=A0A7R8H2U9_LEPSM|nr:KRAB [Lepeophtheirus salmonis]CAF2820845.1 KRAB [Lepeophtheirus salmonis]